MASNASATCSPVDRHDRAVRTLTVGERAEQLRGLSNMAEGVSRSQLQRHFPLEWHGVDSYHRVCSSDCSSLNGVNPDPRRRPSQ